MEDPKRRSLRLFGGRLILKIAASTLVPVAVVAGLGFFWEYRQDRKAAEGVILHEMAEEALALASAIEAAAGKADLRTIVANFLRNIRAENREVFGGLIELGLSKIFVVDASGVVLAGGRPEIIGRPLEEALGHGPMGLPAVLTGREAYAPEFTVGNGRKIIHISVPLHLDPQDPARVTGAVHLMEPYALLEKALFPGIWRRTSVAVALALALVAALSLILGWVVVAPVWRLADGMRSAREGLDVTVPVTSRDEIGDLTTSFNQMVTELRRKASTLATLYAIDRTVSQSLDLEVVLTQTLEKICEVTTVEAGGFYLLEPDGETMVLRVHRGISPAFAEAVGRIRLGEGVSGQAAALRRPVAMDMADYPTPRLAPILEAMGIKHMASAPVISRGQVVGAINVGSHREWPFTQEELNLLGSIGQQVGASIENARLFKQVERAKAEWEDTFDAMPDLVAIVDGEYHLVRVNRAMAERLSVAPEDLVGQRCYAVMHGTDAPWPACPLPQALATGRPASREIEEPHLGGIFHVTTSPLVDADGRAAWCVHIVRDITERKRLEEEARQRQRFEDLSRAKSAFIATMSHELRTPLNSVIGFSDLLLEQIVAPLTEKQARYLGHIHSSGKHLLQLISDILDLSKVEAGKIVLQPERLPVAATLEDILVIARGLAKKGQIVEADIAPDLPSLQADPIRFKQICFNLLSNAVKFTPNGGTITVRAYQKAESTKQKAAGGEQQAADASVLPSAGCLLPSGEKLPSADRLLPSLVIEVTDTGIGIRPEDLPRLFQEFVQLETSATQRHEGTGLGLALTKRLVELHGGRIWAASEGEGRGSTFTVLLLSTGPEA